MTTRQILRRLILLSTCLALLFLAGVGPGIDTAEAAKEKQPSEIDREKLEKLVRTYDVVVRDRKAYVARTSGMDILNLEDISSPVRLGSLELTGTVNSLTLKGDLAFLAAGTLGMIVVDVSDPENPRLVSEFNTPGQTHQILVRDQIALLADGLQGLVAVDISRPDKPKRRTNLSSRNRIRGMAMAGDVLVLAEGVAGARIIDISRPSHPRHLYTLRNTEGALDVAVEGNTLVIASGKAGLKVFAKRPGGRFEEISAIGGDGRASRVILEENIAYVCRGPHGIQIVDLTNPAAPQELLARRLPRGFPALNAWIQETTLFIAAEISGLAALELANKDEPEFLLPRSRTFKVSWPK